MPRRSKGTRVNRKLKPQTLPDKFTPGFTAELDNRTLLSRALRQRFEAIAADLGGDLSNLKASLLERYVWLEALMCRIEGELATADDPNELAATLARWIQLCNAFQGIVEQWPRLFHNLR